MRIAGFEVEREEGMEIRLMKAGIADADRIHAVQVEAFLPLLDIYQDVETSPACEGVEMVRARIMQPVTDYYMVLKQEELVGAIRIRHLGEGAYRVGPVFVLPKEQNQGLAQKAFQLVESLYPEARIWELDTILEEKRNCHLYEKLGYMQTGQSESLNERLTLVMYRKEVPGRIQGKI